MLKARRHHARRGISTHDGATGNVRPLIHSSIKRTGASRHGPDQRGPHRASNLLSPFGAKGRYPSFIFAKIKIHAHERLTEGVCVVRIEIQIIFPMRITTALRTNRTRMGIPLGIRLFPTRTPARCARW